MIARIQLKVCAWIFMFNCLCQFSFSQDKSYKVSFEPLKEFESKAPDYLLRRLDSIFLSKKKIELKPTVHLKYIIDNYTKLVKKPTAQNLLQSGNEFYNDIEDWTLWPDSMVKLRFKKDYYYELHNRITGLGVGDELNVHDSIWLFNTTLTDYVFSKKDSTWREHYDYRAPSNTGYFFNNLFIDRDLGYEYPNSVISNSILKGSISASVYRTSILSENHFLNPFKDNNYMLLVDSCYVYNYTIRSHLRDISFTNSLIDSLTVNYDSITNFFIDHIGPDLHGYDDLNATQGYLIPELGIEVSNKLKSNYLSIVQAKIRNLVVGSSFKKVAVNHTSTQNTIFNSMLDTLIIRGGEHQSVRIFQENRDRKNKSKIFLYDFDLNSLDTRWLGYELFKPDSTMSDEKFNSIYLDLLSHFKSKGFDDSYVELDKEYRSWNNRRQGKPFKDWIQRTWSNYGYDKSKIVWNTIYIFLFFSFLNSLWLKTMSKYLYKDENVWKSAHKNRKKAKWTRWVFNIPPSLFYTSRIFFALGFRYDNLIYKDKLNNGKVFYLLYFFAIFVIGLICLAYIINFVISL